MKQKTFLALMSALMCLVACSCSIASESVPSDGFRFENRLGQAVTLYVVAPDKASWGQPVAQEVATGSYADVTLDVAVTKTYDVGIIAADSTNYDFYQVSIAPGDTLKLTSSGKLKVGSTAYSTVPYEASWVEADPEDAAA